MEDAAIREGFASLRPGTEYDALYEAALCRERAAGGRGLLGLVFALHAFHSGRPGGAALPGNLLRLGFLLGRVMTPTLAMVCGREAAIRDFQSEPFYTVQLAPEGFVANGGRMNIPTSPGSIPAMSSVRYLLSVRG